MSTTRTNRRFSVVGTLIVSALGLCALALPLSPAKAQCLGVDLGIGCAGLGVGSWYTQPRYYGYPYYSGQPYYGQPYYGQPYYGYPVYNYPGYRPEFGYQ